MLSYFTSYKYKYSKSTAPQCTSDSNFFFLSHHHYSALEQTEAAGISSDSAVYLDKIHRSQGSLVSTCYPGPEIRALIMFTGATSSRDPWRLCWVEGTACVRDNDWIGPSINHTVSKAQGKASVWKCGNSSIHTVHIIYHPVVWKEWLSHNQKYEVKIRFWKSSILLLL